jgi:hypothetical protein
MDAGCEQERREDDGEESGAKKVSIHGVLFIDGNFFSVRISGDFSGLSQLCPLRRRMEAILDQE